MEWVFPLNEDEKQTCFDLANTPGAPRKLVAPLPDYKSWAIRTYLGGHQRIVGIIQGPNLETAFRFADMIKMHFWKHRVRGAVEPGDGELNLSADRAKMDLMHETGAVQLIKEIEAHLIKVEALFPLEGASARDKAAKDRVSRQRTLTGCLMETQGLWAEKVSALTQAIEAQGAAKEMWAEKVGALTKALADVVKAVEAQGEMIKVLASKTVYTSSPRGPQVFPGTHTDPLLPPWSPPFERPHTGTPLPQSPYTICGNVA